MVSDAGGKKGFVYKNRWKAYEALKAKFGKKKAAQIANAGHTHMERHVMAEKGARTRKLHGRTKH
jgi:hypothetical protein